jgi:hypothetical protein
VQGAVPEPGTAPGQSADPGRGEVADHG